MNNFNILSHKGNDFTLPYKNELSKAMSENLELLSNGEAKKYVRRFLETLNEARTLEDYRIMLDFNENLYLDLVNHSDYESHKHVKILEGTEYVSDFMVTKFLN